MIKCNNECPRKEFGGCCYSCPNKDHCEDMCSEHPDSCGEATFDENTALATFEQKHLATIQAIASLVNQKKDLEAQEKVMKDKLKEAMEQLGIKKFESDILDITYIAETTAVSLDTAKVKKLHPEIAEECSKTSVKSAYIKVEVKGGDVK